MCEFALYLTLLLLLLNDNSNVIVYCITKYHLTNFSINPSTISVTSFSFAKDSQVPDWVDSAIGNNAVYWQSKKDYHYYPNGDYKDIPKARNNYKKLTTITLPTFAYEPACYIELLGFVRLMRNAPFRGPKDRYRKPSTGVAKLIISGGYLSGKNDDVWKCYYRAMYENWRKTDDENSFWSTFIYCPRSPSRIVIANNENSHIPLTSEICDRFEQRHIKNNKASITLELYLDKNVTWYANFSTYYDPVDHAAVKIGQNDYYDSGLKIEKPDSSNNDEDVDYSNVKIPSLDLAVCTAWPYSTSHPDKVEANQALVYEFIRYYSNLGMKLFVYDRDGANARGSFDSIYAKANPQNGVFQHSVDKYLYYNNYTIQSIILPDGSDAQSDMEGTDKDDRTLFNNDRTLTYSHCRFVARVKYNITKVLLIDFDEFLYCKHAKPIPESQALYMYDYFANLTSHNIDQVMIGKTTIASKTKLSVHECVVEQLRINKDHYNDTSVSSNNDNVLGGVLTQYNVGNIYNCFSSIKYITEIPNVKSIQLNNKCPVSSMHHACAPCPVRKPQCSRWERRYEAYDCICESAQRSSCDFIHLSLVEKKYKYNPKSKDKRIAAFQENSELYYIANAKHYSHK